MKCLDVFHTRTRPRRRLNAKSQMEMYSFDMTRFIKSEMLYFIHIYLWRMEIRSESANIKVIRVYAHYNISIIAWRVSITLMILYSFLANNNNNNNNHFERMNATTTHLTLGSIFTCLLNGINERRHTIMIPLLLLLFTTLAVAGEFVKKKKCCFIFFDKFDGKTTMY